MLILHQKPTSTTVKCWFHKNAWPQRYSFGLIDRANCRNLPHSTVLMLCFIQVKVDFEKKYSVLHTEKFLFLVRTSQKCTITLQHLLYIFLLHYLPTGHSRRLITKEDWLYFEVIMGWKLKYKEAMLLAYIQNFVSLTLRGKVIPKGFSSLLVHGPINIKDQLPFVNYR